MAAAPQLTRQFNRLAAIMIEAEQYRRGHPESDKEEVRDIDYELSDQLRLELNRIYCIEEGRHILEMCQVQALKRMETLNEKF